MKTILTLLVLAMFSIVPLGSSEVASLPLENPATVAPATHDGVVARELLRSIGLDGNLGIEGRYLDAVVGQSADAVGSPAGAVANARQILADLQEASGPTATFAAASKVTGFPVTPSVPSPQPLVAGIVEFYGHSGASISLTDLLDLKAAVDGADPAVVQGLSVIVAAMNDAAEARSSGDQASMNQATASLVAAIEQAVPAMSASASSSSCGPQFTDPLGFIIVAGTCPDTHSAQRALSIDLGGSDTYTNNAGGAQFTTVTDFVRPTTDTPGLDGSATRFLGLFSTAALRGITNGENEVDMLLNETWQGERLNDTYDERAQRLVNDNAGVPGELPGYLSGVILPCIDGCTADPNVDETAIQRNFPVAVALDLGGADTYVTSQDVSQGAGRQGIGVLVDLGGDGDSYSGGRYAQGAAERGVGLLYDDGGDDDYLAGSIAQGAFDAGYLLDAGGSDSYEAGAGSQGGRTVTLITTYTPSILFDASGDDTYTVDGNGQGAGNYLIDGSGNDVYVATGTPIATATSGAAQGASFFASPGLLLDGSGDDTYTATTFGAQAFALDGFAPAALIDLLGHDTYTASNLGQSVCNVEEPFGSLLYDGGGDDTYSAVSGQGLSRAPCSAYLVDRSGDDTYTTTGDFGQGSTHPDVTFEGLTLLGALVDGGGDDTYNAGSFSQGSSRGSGLAVLLDADGIDNYTAGDSSQGFGSGGAGLLVDGLQDAVAIDADGAVGDGSVSLEGTVASPGDGRGGDNYVAGDFSQGSGGGGVGLLLDNDDESESGGGPHASTFTAGVFSQGSATGGVGVFLNREGRDTYTVSDGDQSRGYAATTTTDGLAIGLFVELAERDSYTDMTPSHAGNDRCIEKGQGGLSIDASTDTLPAGCDAAVSTFAVETILAAVFAQPGEPSPCQLSDYFCDDLEGPAQAWVVDNSGLNQWYVVDQQQTPGADAYSGDRYWYVGAPGVPGVHYLGNDGNANPEGLLDEPLPIGPSSLTSPNIDLTGATAPEFTARIAGSSEEGWDFLRIGVVNATGIHPVANISGSLEYDPAVSINLTAFAGQTIQVRFAFVTDWIAEPGVGWNVDDIRVAEAGP